MNYFRPLFLQLLLFAAFFPFFPTHAEEMSFAEYRTEKRKLMGEADRCDLMGAREIYQLTTEVTVADLTANISEIRQNFLKIGQDRAKCYDDVLTKTDDFLALSRTEDSKIPKMITEMDSSLLNMLKARRTLHGQLLAAQLSDIENDVAKAQTIAKDTSDTTFVSESPTTRALVRQDMTMVMETERRQMTTDEASLILLKSVPEQRQLALLLSRAHHALSRAMLTFEEMDGTKPQVLLLARLRSEPTPAAILTDEIALRLTAQGKGKTKIEDLKIATNLNRQLNQVVTDLELAQTEATRGITIENPENWLSALYERLSLMTRDVLTLLQSLEN